MKHMNPNSLTNTPWFIGFEGFNNFFEKPDANKYPPFNLIKHSDDSFVVEIAVAGFSKDEIDVIVQDHVLIISGNRRRINKNVNDSVQYLHKGIGTRAFRKEYTLPGEFDVTAEMEDGILTVYITRKEDQTNHKRIEIS